MTKVLDLNEQTVTLLGRNERVRVRHVGDMLQIRPSARVASKNLPKGEALRLIDIKKIDGKPHAFVNLDNFGGRTGQTFEVAKGKYGWLNLNPIKEAPQGTATAEIVPA